MIHLIPTRELSKRPGQVLKKVNTEGPQVITQNGVPAAMLVPVSGRGIEEDLDLLQRLLFSRSLDALQTEAARTGTSNLSPEAIEAEISARRKSRRRI